ncbi:hypothetical protein EMN47_15055 [Prolixibacteraceae bacterium JC049]|nr:hypothetical protein [Prolixibacteraceae bacterium JC049]
MNRRFQEGKREKVSENFNFVSLQTYSIQMQLSFKIIIIGFLLTISVHVFGFNWKINEPVDRNMILTVELTPSLNFEKAYKAGARAFMINLNHIQLNDDEYSNEKNSRLYHESFSLSLNPIFQKLEENRSEVIILILKGRGISTIHLEKFLKDNGLLERIYRHTPESGWPQVSNLINSGKRLIVFNEEKDYRPQWLNYIWQYTFQTSVDSPQLVTQGKPTNDFYWLETHQNGNNILKQIKTAWQVNGRMPNFIVSNAPLLNKTREVVEIMQELDYAKGQLTCNKRLLEDVAWRNHSITTNGKFELLFNDSDTLVLHPQKNGFKFTPSQQIITRKEAHKTYSFEGIGLSLDEQQVGYFPFDNTFNSSIDLRLVPYVFGPSLVENDIRGKVALFSGKDIFQIDLSSYYDKTAHFTSAFWFKIDNFHDDNLHLLEARGDANILLHIRNRKVFLAIGNNEIALTNELNYEWNHVAITVDDVNNVTLYINGHFVDKLATGLKQINPDKLFFGQRRGRSFSGQLDNLRIWNRTLSQSDIQNLFQKEHKTPNFRDELIAYYPLNGSAVDKGENNSLDGTPSDVSFPNDSIHGQVAQFNGETSYIDCGNSSEFDITNVITVAAWVKPTLLHDHIAFVGKGFAYSAKMWEDYMLFTTTFISDHRTPGPVMQLNKWQHVAYVFNAGGTVQFYHNGEMVYETLASPLSSYTNSFFIGRNLWGQFFKGFMDELYVWNRALSPEEIRSVFSKTKNGQSVFYNPNTQDKPISAWWWIIAVVIGAISAVVIRFIISKFKTEEVTTLEQVKPEAVKTITNTINVFGGFTIFDRDGNDITSKFTPKLRQLFLAILLYQFQNKKGITSKQLNELLWPDYTPQSAKNIRSTNMQNLRNLLANLDDVELVYESRYWNVTIGPGTYCDFTVFNQLTENADGLYNLPVSEQMVYLKEFIKVVEKGPILPGLDLAWLDDFKGDITSNVIEVLSGFVMEHQGLMEKKLLILLLNTILLFDTVNEEAMILKVRSLCETGKSSVARTAYDKFAKEYLHFYGESYAKTFQQVMH